MQILTFFKKEKNIFLILFLLSLIALSPYVLATLYIHPNADDFGFSARLQEMSRFDFVSYFYNSWSGRFLAFGLLSLPKAHIIASPFWYTLIPNIFIFLTGVSLYKILSLFLNQLFSKWKISVLSLFLLAFYITGLR